MEQKINDLIRIALKFKASDIHFNYKENILSIELRVGDKMKKIKNFDIDYKIINYLKYISKIELGNFNKPQTGSFSIYIDNKEIALRFAILNNQNTTNAVLRILNVDKNIDINKLYLNPEAALYLDKLLSLKDGLVIFSGPTGSGKTTSLYTILNYFKNRKIVTIEDPIEIIKDDIIQLQVNESVGFSYYEAIKQVLRHDPDIIMVGEIRDELAAKAAIRAANTGHLVLASIHSPSCQIAINRLLELGVDFNNLKMVLKQVYNQRLFNLKKGGKASVYEVSDEKDLEYYFKNNSFDKQYQNIHQKINIFKSQIYN